MIATYRNKDTEKVANGIRVKKFEAVALVAQRRLSALEAAMQLDDLLVPPGNCLEALKADRKGQHSIRINDQYRICFEWKKEKHTMSKSRTTTKGAQSELLPLVTPGEYLNEELLKPLGISMNALALALRVPANRILSIVKGERAITADTALRLGQYFGMSPEFWINLQGNYDLKKAKREKLEQIQHEVIRRSAA